MTYELILIVIFLSASVAVYVLYSLIYGASARARRIESAAEERKQKLRHVDLLAEEEIDQAELQLASARAGQAGPAVLDQIEHYFESVQQDDIDAIRRRLVRAGYFSRRAVWWYQLFRIAFSVAVFALAYLGLSAAFPEVASQSVGLMSILIGAVGFMAPSFYVDRLINAQEENLRRAFPDFMDMMIVCTDAGLSLEAAANRVAREFLQTHRVLGIHLSVMMLEVRAGKRLRDALSNLADRLHIDEAKSLAVLFKQSEELGSSLTQALRVYSEEMREMRMLRAEEKANALPVKMIFPLAGFLFPVTMAIVVLPVLLTLLRFLSEQSPQ